MAWVSDMGADFTPDGGQYQLFSILFWPLEESDARLTLLANIRMAVQACVMCWPGIAASWRAVVWFSIEWRGIAGFPQWVYYGLCHRRLMVKD